MHSFTYYILNKAQIFRLQRSLQLAFVLFFLISFQKGKAQCPVANPVAATTICSGTITAIALTSDLGGTTYTWTAVQTDVVGSGDCSTGCGSTIGDTLTAVEVFPGTVAYTVTPFTAGCPAGGTPIVINITVNPIPLAIASNSTICSGATSSVAITSDVVGTTFAWTVIQAGVSGASPGAGSLISQTLNTTGPSSGIATYNIIPTADGCVGEPINTKVTIRQLPALTLGANPEVCVGTLTANLTYSSTGGSPNQYSVNFDATAEGQGFVDVVNQVLPASPIVLVVPGGAAVGVYNAVLSVNNTINGCPGASYPITVTVSAPTPQVISGTTPICVGATATWTSTSPGGTWSSATPGVATVGAASGIVTGIAAGTSDITYSVTIGGCVNTAIKTVTITASTPQVITGTSPICVGDAVVWTSTTGGGSWSSATPGVATVGAASGLVTGISAGTSDITYSVTIGGCVNTAIKTVTVSNPTPQVITGTSPLCVGATATWTSTSPGGTWSSATPGVASVGAASGLVTAISVGTSDITYSVTIGGCVNTAIKTVTVNASPILVITDPVALCSPATADLTDPAVTAGSTGGLTFTYFTDAGATLAYATPTVAIAGTYYIVGTAVGGCADTAAVTVTVNTKPDLITVPQTVCSPATTADLTDPSVTAGSTPGLVFTYFTDAGATLVYGTPAAATAGTYYIVGTLGGFCSDTTAVDVTVNPSPNVVTNNQTVCSPATVDLTAGAVTLGSTGGLSFSYFTDAGATSVYGTPTVAPANTYYIVGITLAGCSDTTAVTVTVNATPIVVTVPQAACSPAKVNLTLVGVTAGSTPGLSFTYWMDAGATIAHITPTLATTGTYYIVGTIGGCSDTTAVTVTINPKPDVVTNNPATVCAPATVNLTLAAVTASSTAGLTFTYFTDAAATISYPTPTTATSGTYYIVGTVNPGSGCTDTTAVIVTITPKPTVVTVPQTACSPSFVNLTLGGVTAGSTGGLSFTYFTNAGATTPVGVPTAVGTGTYYIVGSTVGGCSDTTAITVTINPTPDVIITPPAAVCSPATIDLTLPAVTAGSTGLGVLTYFLDAGLTMPNPSPSAVSASGTYYIVGTLGSCSDIEPVIVTINPQPSVVTVPLSLCLALSADLTADSVTTGSAPLPLVFTYFFDPAATMPVGDATAVGAGTYYIVGTIFATGCADTSSIDVTLAPVVLTTDQAACSPTTTTDLTLAAVTAGSTPGLIYTYFNDAIATDPVVDPTAAVAGTYYIVGTTPDGCADTTAVTFTVNPKPNVVTVPQTVCAPATVDLTAGPVTFGSTGVSAFSYFTDAAATNVYGTPTTAGNGTYYIVGSTVFGCTDTASVLVTIDAQPTVITVNQGACSPISTIDLTLDTITTGSTPGLDFTYFNDALATDPVVDPTAAVAGTYYIVGTIPGGCSNIAAVTFTVTAKPIVLTSPQSICSPGTIDLTLPAVTAGSTIGLMFSYFNDALAISPYLTPTTTGNGTFYIVGSNLASCSDTTAVVVTIDAKPVLVTVPQNVCTPATTANLTLPAVTSGAGLSYTYFTDPGATSPYGTPTVATAGTYYIVGATPQGCSDTTSVVVTVSPRPSVITVPQPICTPLLTVDITQPAATFGSTPLLTFTYFTDAAATTTFGTPTVAGAGTYYIVGQSAAGCYDTTGITVTVNPKPTVFTNDPPPICSPATSDLTLNAVTFGSTGSLTFSYYSDAGAASVYPTPAAAVAGTYYIVGVTLAGCSDTTAVNVVSDAIPTVVTVPQSICSPSTTTDLTAFGVTAGSTAGLTFTYFTDIPATIPVPDETAAPVGTYYIVGSTPGGCTDTTPVVVTLDPGANAGTVTGTSPLCIGATANYSSDGDSGGSWTSSNVLIATVDGVGLVTGVGAGVCDIIYTVNGGCNGIQTAQQSLTITPNASIVSVTGTTPLCIGGTDTYTANSVVLGGGVAAWSSSDLLVATVDGTGLVTAIAAGTCNIIHTITGGCNGLQSAQQSLTIIPDASIASVTGTTPLCIGGTATYLANSVVLGGGVGSWSSSDILVATVDGTGLVTGIGAGTCNIIFTINGGCGGIKTAQQILTVTPNASVVSVTGTTPLCVIGTTTYTANSVVLAGGVGSWSSSNILVATVDATTGLVTGVGAGTCDIIFTINGGCGGIQTAQQSLTVNPLDDPSFTYALSTYCQTDPINPTPIVTGLPGGIFSSTVGLVFVSTATGQIDLALSTLGTYTVTYTSNGLCPNSTTFDVTITTAPSATFSYTGTPYCQDAANPSPAFPLGSSAGTFSSTAGLVFVSTVTGEVDLAASTAGTYTVTNTIAASGACPLVTATSPITITALPVATFSYTGTPYCQNGVNPFPTFSGGGVAGTFSSTAGLVFVSAVTGEVNLALSTAGTYTITNNIAASAGCGIVTATSPITITALPVATFSYTGTPYCQDAANPSPTFPLGSNAGTFSSTAGLVFVSTATGEVDLAASTAGTYTVTNTIAASAGCGIVTATSPITITALPVATFSYTGSPYCQNGVNPFPTFNGGGVAGTFSSTVGLVFVSAVTGEVNLALSTAGTYTITNTIAASAGCGIVTATSPITITALPVATFSYTGTPYCPNGINPFPTFSGGGVAGTFSSTAGLSFVSASTGEVDLAASISGTYTVTNTIVAANGCPIVTATSTITINTLDDATFSYPLSTFCQTGANPTPIVTGLAGGTYSSTPGLVFVSALTGEIDLAGSTLGTYTITYTTNGPCPNTGIFIVTITLLPDATFSYAAPSYCQGIGSNPLPVFPLGSSAGAFSALPAGLVFADANTGEIDIVASAPGVYTITNFIAASGGCSANSATFPLTINAIDDASFTYSLSTFCQAGINPTPIVTGLPGGTFSSTIGLVFVDANTGEIDLAGSVLGTYIITYTTSGPCPNTGVFNITITLSPSATFSYLGPYCLGGSPDPSPTFPLGSSAGTFSSTPGLIFINAATGQIDLSASTPGTYVVTNTIAASGGCPAAFAINSVTINDLPTISAAGPDQINTATCGLTSANLAANAPIIGTGSWSIFSGAGGSFTLATDPTTIFNGVAGNTYVLIWTISNAPCTASTDSVTIKFNQVPTTAAAGLDQTSSATCGLTSVTLAANAPIIGTGNWSIFSGVGGSFVLATDPTTVFSGTAGNTYVLVWTISNAPCTASTDSVTIKFNQAPTTATAGPDQTGSFTCGLTSVTLSANSPIIGTGSWSVSSGVGGSFVLASDPTTLFSGTAGSTYVLRWTITNSPCVSMDSVTITFNVFPTVVTNNPAAVCSPATVDITAAAVTLGSTASLSYTYFTDAIATTSYLTPATAVAGTYYIVGATSAGCTDTTAVVVTVNSSPDVTATGINLTCFNVCNGSAIATVVGGTPDFTYVWSSGPSLTKTAATDTITGLCISGYTVTVTDANGCPDTDSITLTQPTQIVPNITTGNISCLGVCDGLSESSPTGGTAPYTFAWNTGSVDTLITDLCPGTYTVIVTDSFGCTISLPDTIVQAATVLSNAIITNATCGLCDGQVVLSPSGGISPYTFLWGSGQTSDTETNLCAGLYSVNITDSAGCSSSYSIPISNPGGPTSAAITSTNISCFGLSDGSVTAVTPAGGTPPYSYLWIQGGQTTPTLSNLGAGVYYVQIADSIGCSLIDSVIITEPTQVVVNQFITAATCGACDGSLSVAPSGGAAPYTVVWNTGSVLDTISSLCPGFYSVQITDFVGCSQSIVMPLNSLNAPTLTTSSVPLLCNAACNATATVVAAGGILPYTYLWNDPGAQTTDVATALCAGTYFVQVTGGGCVSFASVEITDPAPIGFSLANSVDPLCNGNSNGSVAVIPFGGTLPYTFSWTGSGSVSDTASGLAAGIYTVTVTDANGCTSSQSNTLVDPDSLTISNVPTPASCNTIADGAIDVTVGGGTPGYTYQWSGGSALTTQDLTGILIGSYDITVTDTNGCTITDNIIITSTVTVNAVAGNDTAFCEPGTMLLSASGSSANVINYQWFQIPANTLLGSVMNVSVTPAVGVTDYYVIVDNGAGCAHNDTITVTVNALPVASAGADVTILATTTTVLGGNPTGPVGATYSWDPIIGLDNGTNSNPVANPTVTTTYTVTVTSAEGCTSTDIVIVTVVANITFANGISPNADGANDEWIIDNIELFPKSVVEVYNRWGELLFQSTGYTEKWKGIYKGKLLPVGTYYYIINLNDPFFPDVLTGPITILR